MYTGMEASNTLDLSLTSLNFREAFSVDESRIMQLMEVDRFQSALDAMHKEAGKDWLPLQESHWKAQR